MELNMESIEAVPGLRATETSHVRQCEQELSECGVCLSWFEELAQCVSEGRVVIESESEQLELGAWE